MGNTWEVFCTLVRSRAMVAGRVGGNGGRSGARLSMPSSGWRGGILWGFVRRSPFIGSDKSSSCNEYIHDLG